jgi:hypothetical protein
MLVLSYIWVLALVPFMVTRREYVRWHATQGWCCAASPGGLPSPDRRHPLHRVTRLIFAFGLLNPSPTWRWRWSA